MTPEILQASEQMLRDVEFFAVLTWYTSYIVYTMGIGAVLGNKVAGASCVALTTRLRMGCGYTSVFILCLNRHVLGMTVTNIKLFLIFFFFAVENMSLNVITNSDIALFSPKQQTANYISSSSVH